MTTPTFFTLGYGRWPADKRPAALVAALRAASVNLLVDIRHSPCPSQLSAESNYGPREWHALAGGKGIVPLLGAAGIEYLWAVELGNPQKVDPDMAVLREHLASPPECGWPVHRGLALVRDLVEKGRVCGLMCACDRYAGCHRKPVAEALLKLLPEGASHRDLTG